VTVYADEAFAVSFFMDVFILWIVGALFHRKPSFKRLLCGGFVLSALGCCLAFIPVLSGYINIFTSLTLPMIGIMIAFNPKRPGDFVKLCAAAYVAASAVGGLGMALSYLTDQPGLLGNALGSIAVHFSFKLLLASTCAFYILIKLSLKIYNRRLVRKQVFYPLRIYYREEAVGLTALLDTGNTLREPLSQKPVIIVEFSVVKDFMPDSFKLAFYESGEACPRASGSVPDCALDSFTDSAGVPDGFAARIRMIPFESIGRENGMLLGFRPDKTEIIRENGNATPCDVIIGIYNRKLSSDGAYQCLLNPEIIAQSGMA